MVSQSTGMLECPTFEVEFLCPRTNVKLRSVKGKNATVSVVQDERTTGTTSYITITYSKKSLSVCLSKGKVRIHRSQLHNGLATINADNANVMLRAVRPRDLMELLRVVLSAVGGDTPAQETEDKMKKAVTGMKNQIKRSESLDRADRDDSPPVAQTSIHKNDKVGAFLQAQQGPKKKTKVKLGKEQKVAVSLAVNKKSFFFTGCAGTGKSVVIKEIVRRLPKSTTFVTASTGAAAVQIGGTTLNQFAGVGRGEGSKETLLSNILSNPEKTKRWKQCSTLVIDEISMVDADFMDKLEWIARQVRQRCKPFGGIQLILCGDFFQLPPVSSTKFCFEAEKWAECVPLVVVLTEVFRQKDPEFIAFLEKVRRGQCLLDDANWFNAKCEEMDRKRAVHELREKEKLGDAWRPIVPTCLFSHKDDVDALNQRELAKLTTPEHKFHAVDRGSQALLKSLQGAGRDILCLKLDCQVILTKSLNNGGEGLVNGARGVVVDFKVVGAKAYPIVRFCNGVQKLILPEQWTIRTGHEILASRQQLPLDLGWAISIHKSQGMTLDRVELSLGRVFEFGQTYVALSRARDMSGLIIRDFDESLIRANPNVTAFMEKVESKSKKLMQILLEREKTHSPEDESDASSTRTNITQVAPRPSAPWTLGDITNLPSVPSGKRQIEGDDQVARKKSKRKYVLEDSDEE